MEFQGTLDRLGYHGELLVTSESKSHLFFTIPVTVKVIINFNHVTAKFSSFADLNVGEITED